MPVPPPPSAAVPPTPLSASRAAAAREAGSDVPPLAVLASLVVKSGVALGGLSERDRRHALALVWAGLPEGRVLSEPQVNQLLKEQLDGAAAFLGTDHVELRRWLVDAGWLQRDGFGREYRRVPLQALPELLQPLARQLAGFEPESWCAAQRATRLDARAARRRAWLEKQQVGA